VPDENPLQLPPFPVLDASVLSGLLSRHGLSGRTVEPMPSVGIFNLIFAVGDDLVLRVPRDHPAFVAAARREAVAVPAAIAAGVWTARLVAFDDSLDLLPVPYSLYERVRGETLGLLGLEPDRTPEVWRQVGRNLARLHLGVAPDGPTAGLEGEDIGDPRGWPEALARDGFFSASEAAWLDAWLARLAPAADAPVQARFRHGDVQATNVMVAPGTRDFLALLDFGNAGWGDPAHDFLGVPLRAVPLMLEGYREEGVRTDDGFEARILWRHLTAALWLLRRPPAPGLSWAERPLGMLLEVWRFLGEAREEAWLSLRP
jgi:aminoglycoside phosphotransferase (APT) family kinase protein